ncbi:MAG: DUF4115 domain-containing protein [Proteobacteria bacterium]|nr:DUF4115 domain-containing protein [Pseudomonadota bacterium]
MMKGKNNLPEEAKTNAPPPESVEDLKAVRERGGLSLRDVFKTTRVSLVNLAAVENSDFARLPPPIYARAFIRKYARAVGIDEKPLLENYERYLEGLRPPCEETAVRKPWPEKGRRYQFLCLSLAAVIVAGILVYALFLYDQSGTAVLPAPSAESPPAQEKTEPVSAPSALAPSAQAAPSSPPVAVETTGPPAVITAGEKRHLIIEVRETTWVRITADRNPPYQALLKPGDRIERTASDYFQLDIGNAGGINLTFEGKSLGSPGKSGQVVHMRLPEKDAEKKTP